MLSLIIILIILILACLSVADSLNTGYMVVKRLAALQFGEGSNLIRISTVVVKSSKKGSVYEKGIFVYGLKSLIRDTGDLSWSFPISLAEVDQSIEQLSRKGAIEITWEYKRPVKLIINAAQDEAKLVFYRFGFLPINFTAALKKDTVSHLREMFIALKKDTTASYS